jgi:hypothetical protein
MKKKTVTMILLTLGATTFTLSSCDKSEEMNSLSSNTDVVEKPLGIVNADNGFVYGSYDEQDFFEHGTIVK